MQAVRGHASERRLTATLLLLLSSLMHLFVFACAADEQCNVFKQFVHHTSKLYHCVMSYKNETADDAHFFLYTRRNRMKPEVLAVRPVGAPRGEKTRRGSGASVSLGPRSPVRSRYFNLRASTKVLVHGYNQSSEDKRLLQIKRAYLARGEYNVILVDWRRLAISPCYSNAAAHTHWVGNRTGELIGGLHAGGTDLNSVHIVGFSLGAQVAGYAGCSLAPLQVARITGLDPALPLFAFVHPDDRLDASDARFVDIIHTNGGALGFAAPAGHADFYPNGGRCQPGCTVSDMFCSHGRAPALYLESVRSRVGFKAIACDSYWEFRTRRCDRLKHVEFLGDPCSPHANGSYYLYTHDKKPFAIG